jgi:hypothetical protein
MKVRVVLAHVRGYAEVARAVAAWMADRIDEQECRRRVDAARLISREGKTPGGQQS